ncbi:xanthine dehydrogenase family protein molybdopterin-binding subunit [Rhizobium jaguaris]|uniref:Xanthine dehydrogenase family protein molybdopterin-binding subunit n=1 Tax=Rhizobium jaguaris TaxID=1312183 RepID=A0A387FND5_9HYPH|nr:molybdopterin cofactor-binding domain-containing protein [Rhizobium jaguaris]AYG59989.1 xanthine dehydrogenase family protein molybdopterin-binding subunit [Rhizobium jaguaris]
MTDFVQTRRAFLKASVAVSGGLVLATQMGRSGAQAADADAFVPNAFIRIEKSGPVVLVIPHTEVGQGIYTSSAMLVCEELELRLDQIAVEPAPPDIKKYIDPFLGDQATGGSLSTRADWKRLREAGAAARIMLVGAAAARWGVSPAACRAELGVVHHEASGRSYSYGDLAADAAGQPVPTTIPLKDPKDFRLVGKTQKRLDTPAKVNGGAQFGIDAKIPGMKIGTLAISPVKGGRLASSDVAAARAVPGVRDVVSAGDDLVAVIGDHMWAALQGLEALNPQWRAGENAEISSASHVAALDAASRNAGVVARREGDADKAIQDAAVKVTQVYQSPFMSHSPLEPLNCTLHVRPDGADLWMGTQVPVRAQIAVANATGLPQEKVVVHNMLMGGAFGRKLDIDMVEVAAKLAKNVSYPVKFVWSREQDMTHDYYRPFYYDRVSAGLDNDGRLVGRTHRVAGPSILARWAPPAFKDGLDSDAVEAAAETPYEDGAVLVDYVRYEQEGINTGFWRGVGPTHNSFVVESLIDELAHAAKKDPLDFRRSMLAKNPRTLAALDKVAQQVEWRRPLPKGQGRGLSVLNAFGSFVALCVEVDVADGWNVIIRKVVAAIDCGMTVNPDTVVAQMQGGIIFGLSAAMFSEITFTDGAVDQNNFDGYRVLRMNEAPVVNVHLISSNENPGGVGEAGTAAAAPALTNAIFAACGKRLRKLPVAASLPTA